MAKKSQNSQKTPSIYSFIAGKPVTGKKSSFEVQSPWNGASLGTGQFVSRQQIDQTVIAAKSAQIEWGQTPPKERARFLFQLRELLIANETKLANQISQESGKLISEGVAEIQKGIEVLEFAISLQNMDVGGKLEVSRGVQCEYRRIPLGVVAGVTPFNFPFMVPFWMIPIALALGNAFIWKPSEKVAMTSVMVGELVTQLLKKMGLPQALFSVVQGDKETVEDILAHPDIKAIGFVGSTQVAAQIYKTGASHLKRVLALGGAKNHILLLPDADPVLTAKGIADSFTGCAGQRCMAASVLCTIANSKSEKAQIEKLLAAIKTHASNIKVSQDMGAIISKQALEFHHAAIQAAQKSGANVSLDGRTAGKNVTKEFKNGNWLGPTILESVKPGSPAATDELFGPILSVVNFKSIHDALTSQRMIPYGNAISVFTQNGGIAEEVIRHGQAGMVGVNVGVPVPREPFSFGGIAASKFGAGDITGIHSLNFWSDIKKVTTKWAVQTDWSWMG